VRALELDDKLLQLAAHHRAGRLPKRQAGAALLLGREDAQLPAEPAVICKFHRESFQNGHWPSEEHDVARGHWPGRMNVLPLRVHAGKSRRRREQTKLLRHQHDFEHRPAAAPPQPAAAVMVSPKEPMRRVTVQDRRRALVRRHHLAGDADGPEAVVRALFALHASDPASVYLSVLARCATGTLGDVADAMYERRELVRWMAMRRTLFVFAREDVPTVQAAVSSTIAATLRRRLISQLARNGSDPPIAGDLADWLSDVETRAQRALTQRGTATGAELAADEPILQTRILARTRSEQAHNVTTPLLTLLSAEGRIVRATPTGAWTSRQHRWEPITNWWPEGLPVLDPVEAQRDLARRWLTRFGPATVEDLRWWTGWNLTTTRRALGHLAIEEVDLQGQAGIDLAAADRELDAEPIANPVAALLPALDPTPMGYKHRDWFLGIARGQLFDGAGNIGPTLWWDGEIIGSWAITPDGDLRWKIVADRGAQARCAVEQAAATLHTKLHGAVITPAIHAPLERSLAVRPAE
jgi:hypothetical protein